MKKLSEMTLEECKKLGINKVLICCDKSNIGSAQSSFNNGGILENEFINSDGEMSSDIGLI